jgi:hypothetical protein
MYPPGYEMNPFRFWLERLERCNQRLETLTASQTRERRRALSGRNIARQALKDLYATE